MALRLAILASGRGSNCRAIVDCINSGQLDATVAIVLSNNPAAPVLDFACSQGIAAWAQPHAAFDSREAFDEAMLSVIREAQADVVVLAGYMRLLSANFVKAFSGRLINIHPALLPSFPGVRGVGDALEYGVRIAGVTVHFVDENMDTGPVIIQAALPVLQDDTEESLMQRIHALEYRIYPQAIQWIAEERLVVEDRLVRLLPKKNSGATQTAIGGKSTLGTKCSEDICLISPALENF